MTAPALMATLISEEKMHEKEPFYAFSQDTSKSYLFVFVFHYVAVLDTQIILKVLREGRIR